MTTKEVAEPEVKDLPRQCATCWLDWVEGNARCPECQGLPPDQAIVVCPKCSQKVGTVGRWIAPHGITEDDKSPHCWGTGERV